MSLAQRFQLVTLLVAAAGCGTKQLPPPQAPERLLPPVAASGAPADGRGRVLLDVDGDHAVVDDVSGGSVSATGAGRVFSGSLEVSQRLCVTPCVVDLTPGPHTLRFHSTSDGARGTDGYVNVDAGVNAYRVRLGQHRHHHVKRFAGIVTAVLSGLFLLDGVAARNEGVTTGDRVGMIGIGAGLGLLAYWLIHTSASVDQEGTGVQWPVTSSVAGR
jgi:hypothetical protein